MQSKPPVGSKGLFCCPLNLEIYLQRFPSRLKMRYGNQLSLSVERKNKQQTGREKGGTKRKRNSEEARRRAKRGGKKL